MQCDICSKKKATVHLTEIVDEQMSEMHLCEECAREKSVQMEQQFGLSDLLAGLSDFNKQTKKQDVIELKCENCGMRYDDFRKFGRLGCGECYDYFRSHLSSLLKKIHNGASQHFGKTPKRIPKVQKERIENLQNLKNQLMQAIQVEDYEKAAELRDKIRSIENKDKK